MKAKWVNIVDSLPRNEEDIKDRYIEISKNRNIEREKKRIKQTINNKQHYKTILC